MSSTSKRTVIKHMHDIALLELDLLDLNKRLEDVEGDAYLRGIPYAYKYQHRLTELKIAEKEISIEKLRVEISYIEKR